MTDKSPVVTTGGGKGHDRMQELMRAVGILSEGSLVELMEALETLLVYVKNLIHFPEERKYRKVKITNVHYQERLGHLGGAQEAMSALGYVPDGDYLRLNDANKNDGLEVLRSLEQYLGGKLDTVKESFSHLPHRLTEQHEYKSIYGAGICSETGKRHSMEDDDIIVDGFAGLDNQAFFGLYDGHGGRATVDFVVKALHVNLACLLRQQPPTTPIHDIWKDCYLATDGQLRRRNILRSGSTSVTCVLRQEQGGKRVLYTANVGDSRAVLVRGGKAIRLTVDHKASCPEEEKRIKDAGGFIARGKRVNGVLAVSRALGDHMFKENDIVSAIPYCATTELSQHDSHLLLACDGVWDVVTDQEAADFLLAQLKEHSKGNLKRGKECNTMLTKVAKALAKEALDRRSLDNITVMVIQL